MATNDVNLQVINSMTQEQMQSLKDSSGKIPSLANQLIMTDEEDVNLSQLRTKVLWTNPFPTTSFDTSTTISLGSENYSYLLIEYMAYPTIYASMIVPFKEGEGSIYYSLSDTGTSNSTYFVQLGQREFTINSSKQIKFGDGYWVNHSEKLLLNNYMIPTKITGILKQPAMIYTGKELHEGNGIKIDNGVISASNMKVLWTNPNPSSSFSAQTITLSSSDYDYLLFEYKPQHSWNITECAMCKKGTNARMYFIYTDSAYARYYIQVGTREASYISDTSYSVGNIVVFDLSGYSESNSRAVPVRVIGVKVV